MNRNDTDLTKEIKEGSSCAFKKLFDEYHRQLHYVAKKYLKDEDLAKDAVQDIYIKLWEKRQNLDPSSSIEGLLFTMLKNHLLNMIRNEKNRKKIIDEMKKTVGDQKHTNVVVEEIIYSEYESIFKRALAKLSPTKREVFKLRSFKGLSNEEVAHQRDVSKHTVKTQYYLSSKFIRNYLKKHAGISLFVLAAFSKWII